MSHAKTNPWLHGIVDTLVGAELLRLSAIANRNRLSVILIDSAFETACRAYLRHKAKINLEEKHKHRANLISTVKGRLSNIDNQVWDSINFYYEEIRCDLYHQSAAKTIVDSALLDYREVVEFVIDAALGCSIRQLVDSGVASALDAQKADDTGGAECQLQVTSVEGKVNKVLVAVAALSPADAKEVNDFFKREGESIRLKPAEFRQIVAQNRGSKKYFYYDRIQKKWLASQLGKFRLTQL